MEHNPYASSPIQDDIMSTQNAGMNSATQILGVDRTYLVVRSGAVLPPICVKTGMPVPSERMREKKIYWATPWIWLLSFINLIVVFIAYLIVKKECRITFGLSKEAAKMRRKTILIKLFVAIGLLIAFFITLVYSPEQPLFLVTLIAFLIAIIVLLLGNSTITVKKYRDGAFWIKGIAPQVLDRIATSANFAGNPSTDAIRSAGD